MEESYDIVIKNRKKQARKKIITRLSFILTFLFCNYIIIKSYTCTSGPQPYYLIIIQRISSILTIPWWWILRLIGSVLDEGFGILFSAIIVSVIWGIAAASLASWILQRFDSNK